MRHYDAASGRLHVTKFPKLGVVCEARFLANYNGVDSEIKTVALEKIDGCQDPGSGRMVSVGTQRDTQVIAYREEKPKGLCSTVSKPLTITCQAGGTWSSPSYPAGYAFQSCEDGCYNSVRGIEGWYASGQSASYTDEVPVEKVSPLSHSQSIGSTQCINLDYDYKERCGGVMDSACEGTVTNAQYSCKRNPIRLTSAYSCSATCVTSVRQPIQRVQFCERGTWR